MRVTILASGSSGNCTYVEGQSGSLLIDAGLSAREVLALISLAGLNPSDLGTILTTHEHGDHLRGVYTLARRLKIPVMGTEGTLHALASGRAHGLAGIETTRCRYSVPITECGMEVIPLPTSHDAAEPCGFFIRDGDLSLTFYTDTGEILPAAESAMALSDALVLESNHCPVMLRDGPYPEVLKRRIRSRRGHLSNTAVTALLRDLGDSLPPLVMLAHLSEVNNTPDKALASAREGTGLRIDETTIQVGSNRRDPSWPRQIRI